MAKTRKPQQERSKQTVSTIIEAGLICVSRYGVEGTTTRKIADLAGISVGSLYEYFADKDEVFTAMQQHVIDEIANDLIRPLTPKLVILPAKEAVLELLFGFRNLLKRNDSQYLHYVNHIGQHAPPELLKPVNQALADFAIQYLMHHPELSQTTNIPVASYIMIHGGVSTVLRHLTDPSPPFEFEALCEGLAMMISHMIEGDLKDRGQM
jgi:AcrR family transcriptional regulator